MLAVMLVLYVLTAPPVMSAIVRQRGSVSVPALYQPVLGVLESDYNGPLLWYFNDVWHSEVTLFGESSTPPLVIAAYALGAVLLAGVVVFPFLRRRFRRTQT